MTEAQATIDVAAAHQFTRSPGTLGATRSTCSCGVAVAHTNAPQHIARAERSHRKYFVRKALRAVER